MRYAPTRPPQVLGVGGGTVNFAMDEIWHIAEFHSAGGALLANWVLQHTGTPAGNNITIKILWDAPFTLGVNAVTIFGRALTQFQVSKRLVITCSWDAAAVAWKVYVNIDDSATGLPWLLGGNTNAAEEYIGTNNGFDFPMRTNTVENARLFATGQFGVGITAAPAGRLHVKGAGATAATYSAYFENSASTRVLAYRNDGAIFRDTFLYSVWNDIGAGTNTSWGREALNVTMTGRDNTAVGYRAMQGVTSALECTAVGSNALAGTNTATGSTALGYNAAFTSTTASYTVAVGYFSLYNQTTGSYNVGVGGSSLIGKTTGDSNIGIGDQSGFRGTPSAMTNSIYIGKDTLSEANNEVGIGNAGTTALYFGGGKIPSNGVPVAVLTTIPSVPYTANLGGILGTPIVDGNGANWSDGVSRGTGAGVAGDRIWLYSPSIATSATLQTHVESARMKGDTGRWMMSRRFEMIQGADVASAAGAIALGADGNSFEITGTAAITLISNLNWQNGSVVHLLFTAAATLTHGSGSAGTDITILLAGAINFVASAGDTITLLLSEIGGVQAWRETSRAVI